jgi:hypothetical protein
VKSLVTGKDKTGGKPRKNKYTKKQFDFIKNPKQQQESQSIETIGVKSEKLDTPTSS